MGSDSKKSSGILGTIVTVVIILGLLGAAVYIAFFWNRVTEKSMNIEPNNVYKYVFEGNTESAKVTSTDSFLCWIMTDEDAIAAMVNTSNTKDLCNSTTIGPKPGNDQSTYELETPADSKSSEDYALVMFNIKTTAIYVKVEFTGHFVKL